MLLNSDILSRRSLLARPPSFSEMIEGEIHPLLRKRLESRPPPWHMESGPPPAPVDSDLPRRIAFASDVKEIMTYLSCRCSEWSLDLTLQAIMLNPDNYCVWETRHDILTRLNLDLQKEYDCITSLPIAYDVDHSSLSIHRCLIAQELGSNVVRREFEFAVDILSKNPGLDSLWYTLRMLSKELGNEVLNDELSLTARVLGMDGENNNAWNHRISLLGKIESGAALLEVQLAKEHLSKNANNKYAWSYLLKLAGQFGGDIVWEAIELIDMILDADGKNKLVWFYRLLFVQTGDMTDALMRNEVKYAEDMIRKDPENECPWVHLQSLYMKSDIFDRSLEAIVEFALDTISGMTETDTRVHVIFLETLWCVMKRGYKPSFGMSAALATLCYELGSSSDGLISRLSQDICSVLIRPQLPGFRTRESGQRNFWSGRQAE